jgi:predicted DNA-binding WGR domain protein
VNFKFIGWCNQGKHDKVWGVIKLDRPNVLVFWGRRGAKLQTKHTVDNNELSRLIDSKLVKGYNTIESTHLDQIYPEFQHDLEQSAIWASLKF